MSAGRLANFIPISPRRAGFGEKFPWKSDEEVVALELEPSGVDFKTLREHPEGLCYQEKEYSIGKGTFATPTGKIEIYSEAFEKVGADPLPTYREPDKSPQGPRWADLGRKYPLILSTGTRDFYFNGSMLHNVKSLQLRSPSPKAEIGPKTAAEYGIKHGDDIIVETDRGQAKMKAHVDERIMEGVVLVPHGWPREGQLQPVNGLSVQGADHGVPSVERAPVQYQESGRALNHLYGLRFKKDSLPENGPSKPRRAVCMGSFL